MNKQLLITPIFALTLLGCNSDSDSTDVDSIIVKKNEYYSVPFNIAQNQQLKVKMSRVNEISAEGYIVTEYEFLRWQDVTQTGNFRNATLFPSHIFYLTSSTVLDTDWMSFDAGNYRLLFENTDYGQISPPSHPENKTGTVNIKYSIHKKSI